MASNLCCCSPCRPAYKRHVDSIYPVDPTQGLVKNKMEQLTYFALTSPEKLDRLGEYLALRISRDINRNKKEFVFIGMEAMDQLLSACHVRTLNLFVESYLKTIQRLLESPDSEFQILASKSFTHFSKIEEETPSYHKTYDFFIERFSQMCHSTAAKADIGGDKSSNNLRIAGLNGIWGIIRKTVNEDLAENIWDPKHMEKIVPSLLFNLDPSSATTGRITPDLENLDADGTGGITAELLADEILRELVQAASSISIKAILDPVLQHIDNHSQWDPEKQSYAVNTFNAIMYSIQTDLSYILIEKMLTHIGKANSILQRGNIANVLSKIIGIGVGESTVGPAVLEIITSLLKHLRSSVENSSFEEQSSEPMQFYHKSLFRCLGEYTGKMPDYQKSENMGFILSKIPLDSPTATTTSDKESDVQHILMKALYAVAERHSATLFSSIFNQQLLHSLLRLLLVNDPDVRLLVLQTFLLLSDRHENAPKLNMMTLSPAELDLYGFPVKRNRADQLFAQKSLFKVYSVFKQVVSEQSSNKEFIDTLYVTVSVLAVEMSGTDEGTVFLLDLIDGIQSAAVKELALSTNNRFNLHALAISLFALLAMIVGVQELDSYLEDIVRARKAKYRHMLPPIHEQYKPGLDPNTPDEDVLINVEKIKAALKDAGRDVIGSDKFPQPESGEWNKTTNLPQLEKRPSTVSMQSIPFDVTESATSSPGIHKKALPEELTVVNFKKIFESDISTNKEDFVRSKKEMQTKYIYSIWEELCQNQKTFDKKPDLQDIQQDILSKLSFGERLEDTQREDEDEQCIMEDGTPFGKYFPEIYLY